MPFSVRDNQSLLCYFVNVIVQAEDGACQEECLLLVHAAGNAQAGQNSSQNSYYRLNDKFPSIFFHFVLFF
jgi:hypothetical protein